MKSNNILQTHRQRAGQPGTIIFTYGCPHKIQLNYKQHKIDYKNNNNSKDIDAF